MEFHVTFFSQSIFVFLVAHSIYDLNKKSSQETLVMILAMDFPGGKRTRKIKINAQLRNFKCKPMIKKTT